MRKLLLVLLLISTCAFGSSWTKALSGSLTSGTTTITGGADTAVLFDDAGVVNAGSLDFAWIKATRTLNLKDSGGNVVTQFNGDGSTYFGSNLRSAYIGIYEALNGGVPSIEFVSNPRGTIYVEDPANSNITTITPTTITATTFIGALTGHASLDLALTGGTLTGNLLFTDNTYDIGAEGATRPRTLFLGTSVITPFLQDASADPADSGVVRCGNNVACMAAELATPGTDKTISLNTSNQWSFVGSVITDGGVITGPNSGYFIGANKSAITSLADGTLNFRNADASTASEYAFGTKTLTNATATTIAKVTMTSGSSVGGTISVTLEDTTTRGTATAQFRYAAMDVAGTITFSCQALDALTQTVGGSAGFALDVTAAFTCADAGSNVLNLLLKAATTGGTDVLQLKYTIIQNNAQVITPQ